MRRQVVSIVALAAIAVAGTVAAPKAYARFLAADQKAGLATAKAVAESIQIAAQAAPPPRTLAGGPVTVDAKGYWSWALLDRRTSKIEGSDNLTATNTTESMIKAWIVADFLRQTAASGKATPDPIALKQASVAIRDSNDDAAQELWRAVGREKSVLRLLTTCGLTETTVVPGYWSLTQMSARDAVRMGACIADGRAAGPRWTDWVLTEMRGVRGDIKTQAAKSGGGRWGIIDGLPAEIAPTVAIKNGWTAHSGSLVGDNLWHINCLAIGDDFVLAVEARYPIPLGLAHGAGICSSVTRQLADNATAG